MVWLALIAVIVLGFLIVRFAQIQQESFDMLKDSATRVNLAATELKQSAQSLHSSVNILSSLFESNQLLFSPLVVLVAAPGGKWNVENQGNGPALNIWWSSSLLAPTMPAGCVMPLNEHREQFINSSIAETMEVAGRVRDLESEGYKYADLYGEPATTFEVTIKYESVNGRTYGTVMRWSDGAMKVEFESSDVQLRSD